MLKLEGFLCATALDLNMGYCHIKLSPASKASCMTVLPFGKCKHQQLPMGLSSGMDKFQEKMSEMSKDLKNVHVYINDPLVIFMGSYEDHLKTLAEVLKHPQHVGLKVNAKKSNFEQAQVEHFGYLISCEGLWPPPGNSNATHDIAVPQPRKQLRRFISTINCY